MPTIYTNAESNIRKTWMLVSVFLVIIVGFGWIFSNVFRNPVILIYAIVFSVVMNVASFWYSDKVVLALTRAKPIQKQDNPELYRLVENLCITAGLPTPPIYILNEAQPNAFATGRDKNHAVIAVTRGLLERLDKTELEGVISHELSHIGNKDMLLMTMVVVLVGFISIISNMFTRSLFFGGVRRDNDRDGDRAGSIFALVGIVLAILSPIVAMLIQLAISRKREFLADASGALLTRYPEGLASALEKIAKDPTPLPVANNTTSHMWFDDPFTSGLNQKTPPFYKLFMSHPPVAERIKSLRELRI